VRRVQCALVSDLVRCEVPMRDAKRLSKARAVRIARRNHVPNFVRGEVFDRNECPRTKRRQRNYAVPWKEHQAQSPAQHASHKLKLYLQRQITNNCHAQDYYEIRILDDSR